MTARARADYSACAGLVGRERALVAGVARFGRMEVVATDRGAGRLYRCPCGASRWSSWGNAEHHAQTCPAADVAGAVAEALEDVKRTTDTRRSR